MNKARLILTGHKFYEQIDDKTVKTLCVTCGGKGFYLLCNAFEHKGIIVNCDQCESGFRYGKREG